jgi:hypothetical protein
MSRDPLREARRLFKRLIRCNKKSIARTGDICPADLADLLEQALADEVTHRAVMLALAEFAGNALEGGVIDMESWQYPAR